MAIPMGEWFIKSEAFRLSSRRGRRLYFIREQILPFAWRQIPAMISNISKFCDMLDGGTA